MLLLDGTWLRTLHLYGESKKDRENKKKAHHPAEFDPTAELQLIPLSYFFYKNES